MKTFREMKIFKKVKIVKEAKIVKEVKRSKEKWREVMTCDVSPVRCFSINSISIIPNTLSAYLFKAIWKVPFCAGVPRATCLDLSKLVRITAADNKKEKSVPFSLGHWIFFRKKITKKSDCANPCKILNEFMKDVWKLVLDVKV